MKKPIVINWTTSDGNTFPTEAEAAAYEAKLAEANSAPVWNPALVKEIKKIIDPPVVNNFIKVSVDLKKSKVSISINFSWDSFVAGLKEIGFVLSYSETREVREGCEKGGDFRFYSDMVRIFEICHPRCDQIAKIIIDDLAYRRYSVSKEDSPPFSLSAPNPFFLDASGLGCYR